MLTQGASSAVEAGAQRTTPDGVPLTVTVNRALSMLSPTAKDSMFMPRRANTPATRLMMPDSSATKTEIVCFLMPSFSR